ncbi:tumor necrosis factor receptor superfamily member 16 [Kryptolebias marmoratus]|uniref:Neurotrophin receptor associated death domain n=1 Tax=Kryptolebias marmoratus TaxID=37003 RepID=A0A3Q3B388_KRYMA|nr:tumor necrosis factor receptor superfamily member 16 [Kryptolebias marmoratus]
MRSTLLWTLLLVEVALGQACLSGKFTDSGQCCSQCPVGSGVEVPCGKEDTKCALCPRGTFSSSEDLQPCHPCLECPPNVPTSAPCSASADAECACGAGFFFDAHLRDCAPCSTCRRGEGATRPCTQRGDRRCQICGPGTFSEERHGTEACQTCTRCSDDGVQIRPCLPDSDTVCMDKKLHIMPHGPLVTPLWPVREEKEEKDEEEVNRSQEPTAFPPQDEGGSSNIVAYVSVLAAVVLGSIIYVAYKCWRSCKQKAALSKARAAELGASPEGEKLQSDSGVFLDSYSLQDNQHNKGTKRDSKLDNRLYINLPPHRQEEVERLLQEGGGRGWRHLGAALGYEPEQLDLFGRGEAPARTLLSSWAQRDGSTLGLLCSALARVERPDVAAALNHASQGASVV